LAQLIAGSLSQFDRYVPIFYHKSGSDVVAAYVGTATPVHWAFDPWPTETAFLAAYPQAILVQQVS